MKKQVIAKTMGATVGALALILATAAPAHALSWSGSLTCAQGKRVALISKVAAASGVTSSTKTEHTHTYGGVTHSPVVFFGTSEKSSHSGLSRSSNWIVQTSNPATAKMLSGYPKTECPNAPV